MIKMPFCIITRSKNLHKNEFIEVHCDINILPDMNAINSTSLNAVSPTSLNAPFITVVYKDSVCTFS